jgi:hypothetical protein
LNERLLNKFSAWCQAQEIPKPQQVRLDNLTSYLRQLKTSGLAPASLKQEVAALKGFYGFLRSRYGMKRDPAELLRTPKVRNPLPRTLNQVEMNRLLATELSQHRRLFKDRRYPYWFCQYKTPDGHMVCRTTGQTDREKAWEISKDFVYSEANHADHVISGCFQEQALQRRYPRRDRQC